MTQEVRQHQFANGLTLLAEPMPHVRSAAFNFLLPAGAAYDPPGRLGVGSVLAELLSRGAGPRDSRALTGDLDDLGVDRDESVGVVHARLVGSTLGRNLAAALDIYADIVRRPHLPDEELEPVQSLALQDLEALEDEPRQKVMVELRRRHYGPPLGNDRRGAAADIEALTPDAVRQHHATHFRPGGAILAVAGSFDWPALLDQVGRLFGDWPAGEAPALKLGPTIPASVTHIPKESDQTHIGVAFPSVPIGHADYYPANGAVGVLSGGSSARLFTEVREKRGLCYSVGASYGTSRDRGSVVCYAGTKPERAQETLDVMLGELRRLSDGIEDEEVRRVQTILKSSMIMAQESTSSRAGSLASDWYFLGRVRPLAEVQAAVDALTPASIVEHLRRVPPANFTVVTLGPEALRAG